jgi:DNA-binding MarR family transcriptional regulator
MHALNFRLKRAFQSTLRIARPALRPFGLTPARFDLLYAIQGENHSRKLRDPPSMWQSALRRALGVTAPTVSRMLRSLEELGLVRRWRDFNDTRQRVVELTRDGYALLLATMEELMGSGLVDLAVTSALVYPRLPLPSDFEDVGTINQIAYKLECIAQCFRDTGAVDYPYEPVSGTWVSYEEGGPPVHLLLDYGFLDL